MNKYLFAILACLPVFTFAQGDPTSKVVATLPFRLYDRYMVITACLSSTTDSLHFIFDTGAEVTTLSKATADKLMLETKNDGGLSGNDAVVVRVPTATINVLYLDKTRLPFVKVYIEPLREFQSVPVPLDGIIGVDLLKAFVVKIDYEKQELKLYRQGKSPLDAVGKRLPLSLNFDTPAIEATIRLPSGKTLASRYHFITGGEYGILFNWPYMEKYQLISQLPVLSTDKVQDLYQELTYTNTTIPNLNMGNIRLDDVAASYCKEVNDAGSMSEVAGSIGFMVWRQFRTITINYDAREVYLER
ncbi:retroviral-like aspartic protease family protein [Chitinophaga tropicalis]|uniref:retroviral-like aspartic protease family protein n=1 Tax=Chitinophaga tropicalis TaxID=2683588 RepID=UPI0012F7FF26|nr:retroviral-like aspartic protease family protein [Chitinophaga tropicalis]